MKNLLAHDYFKIFKVIYYRYVLLLLNVYKKYSGYKYRTYYIELYYETESNSIKIVLTLINSVQTIPPVPKNIVFLL